MKKQLLYLLAAVAVAATVFVTGCQKELSFEGSGTPAKGSLQFDVTGDCLPKTVNGIYSAGAALVPATNTITVQVNVTQTGTYVVTTDTVNGYFFRATGTFTALGITTVTLRGNGTPFAAGTDNFVVSYDGTICDIAVTVLPAGAGAAVLTLTGGGAGTPPPSCSGATVLGTYTAGVPLGASHTVVINVNVTTAGSYNISTAPAVNGMVFSGSGSLATGPQTITLTGSGTPTSAGTTTIPITVGTTSCSFTVVIGSGGSGTVNCTGAVVSGTYTNGVALTASNTVQIAVTVTTAGPYTISTNTMAGISFSASGNFAVTGPNTVTLVGTGTPNATGSQTFTVTWGSSTCTFNVTIAGASPAVYSINCGGVVVNGTYTVGTALTAANFITVPITVTTAGTYSITTAPAVNGMTFSASGTLTLGTTSITLTGSGTPTASGTFNLTVGSCSVPVTCTGGGGVAVYTVLCATAVVNGFYEMNSDMNPCNTVNIDVNVTTVGTYTITTSQAGVAFAKSGTFAATGNTNITLQATGRPTSSGTKTFSFPAPSSCSFNVTVDAESPPYDWNFTITNLTPSAAYRGQDDASQLAPVGTGVAFNFDGSNSIGSDRFQFALGDINGTIAAGETYSTTVTFPAANAALFQYDTDCGTIPYEAGPTITLTSMTFTVTAHNVAAKTITGTFSGTAKNSAGQTITITSGTFTGTYP